uniref:Uncharacterized protein n=1 Tax=Anguilla anguilla TaxID=7936 RepID=A0A0E9UPK4_ANGAN
MQVQQRLKKSLPLNISQVVSDKIFFVVVLFSFRNIFILNFFYYIIYLFLFPLSFITTVLT